MGLVGFAVVGIALLTTTFAISSESLWTKSQWERLADGENDKFTAAVVCGVLAPVVGFTSAGLWWKDIKKYRHLEEKNSHKKRWIPLILLVVGLISATVGAFVGSSNAGV